MSRRYEEMFARLAGEDRRAFIPFVQLGDPHVGDPMTTQAALDASFRIILALIEAGADALELGIPFSDPVADGPTIQAAAQRAIRAGVTPELALGLVSRIRAVHADIPIGLLVYANLVVGPGVERFYEQAARAGVDSVLVADVPLDEGSSFSAIARQHGVAPVFIATPDCTDKDIARLASLGAGYTYVVTRSGVTGAGVEAGKGADLADLVARLERSGAPPPVFGFGISSREHVTTALSNGARGVISGSAVVRALTDEGIEGATTLVRKLAAAT